MSFNTYPYTDFHEMNDDWVIAKVKELIAAWAETKADWTQVQSDWEDEQQAFQDLKDFVNTYFDELDVQTEINHKLDEMAAAGTLTTLMAPYVPDAVSAWLALHVDPDTGYVIDDTLSIEGAAADAKATGEADALIRQDYNELLANSLLGQCYVKNNVDGSQNGGLTYDYDATTQKYHIHGTIPENTQSVMVLYVKNVNAVTAGETLYWQFNKPDNSVCNMDIYWYNSGGTNLSHITTTDESGSVVVPADAVTFMARFFYRMKTTTQVIDEYLNFVIAKAPLYIGDKKNILAAGGMLASCDLNDLHSPGCNRYYILTDTNTYTNIPESRTAGFLIVYTMGSWTLQIFVSIGATQIMMRRSNNINVWSDWTELSGGTEVNNYYTYNEYSNSYNVTASPSITTDTNNYLAASGDTTDRATDIETLLSSAGVCHLGPGDFYVSGIYLPEGATLDGCGYATRVILLDSVTDGYTIRMNTNTTVKDLAVVGKTSSITPSTPIGTRNGILWQGAADAETPAVSTPTRGTISNCYITNFTGSGIICYGTGTGISNCLNVANCYISNCGAGINLAHRTEFHRFVNVDCRGCYYGCINNGGNNSLSNCGFSKNMVGLLMDNSSNQSPNNSHGSINNCVFNHSGANNDGTAIQILNCGNGEIFTGCQVFYGSIDLEDSSGIVFDSCNFGGTSIPITVDSGGLVLFNGCVFKLAPTKSITGNNTVNFINCYDRDGSAIS